MSTILWNHSELFIIDEIAEKLGAYIETNLLPSKNPLVSSDVIEVIMIRDDNSRTLSSIVYARKKELLDKSSLLLHTVLETVLAILLGAENSISDSGLTTSEIIKRIEAYEKTPVPGMGW